MENAITLQNVADIVTFVAPGYFLLQVYSLVYAKHERSVSRLIIESAVWSLPLVAGTNVLWEKLLHRAPASSLSTEYALLLVGVSVAVGLAVSVMRVHPPIKQLAYMVGRGAPDEDFVRSQFARLKRGDPVTVTLKSGRVFSGVPTNGSIYASGSTQRYYFDDLAWATRGGGWDVRPGGLLVAMSEVEYIETPKLKFQTISKRKRQQDAQTQDKDWLLP